MSSVDFDEAAILEEARGATGLADFGSDDYLDGLRMLLRTYDENPYSEKGRRRARRRLVALLTTRLRMQDAFARHPEILDRELPRPMVLTGLPRSGTSALFNLLAADSAARPLLLWETQCPDPVESGEPGEPDPRRAAIEAYYEKSREKNPEFTKIHFASADTPEECVLIHAYALNGVQIGVEVMLEPYASWYRSQDLRPMYAYYRDILRLLDWQRPGERWLLKAPAHMWAIDALVETFPDVCVVWSHRNPVACIASICSMTAALMEGQVDVDLQALGPVVMDFYATSLERGLEARARCDAERFVDVGHDELVAGALGVVSRIYDHFDLELGASARSAMAEHERDNPKGRHGEHRYDLETYGLDAETVHRRFGDYEQRFLAGTG